MYCLSMESRLIFHVFFITEHCLLKFRSRLIGLCALHSQSTLMIHNPTLNWILHNVVFSTDGKLLESILKVAQW